MHEKFEASQPKPKNNCSRLLPQPWAMDAHLLSYWLLRNLSGILSTFLGRCKQIGNKCGGVLDSDIPSFLLSFSCFKQNSNLQGKNNHQPRTTSSWTRQEPAFVLASCSLLLHFLKRLKNICLLGRSLLLQSPTIAFVHFINMLIFSLSHTTTD